MGNIIRFLEDATVGKFFASYRRPLDVERSSIIEYDPFDHQFMAKPGETTRYQGPVSIQNEATTWLSRESPFVYFLDGSRRTYKIADIPISTQFFPLIAGQVGVGVCRRAGKNITSVENGLMLHNVLALPRKLDTEGKNEKQNNVFFSTLLTKLNDQQKSQTAKNITIDALLFYITDAHDNLEDKGIAKIHDYMIEREKEMVKNLVDRNLLNDRAWLIKDGSLEYKKVAGKDNPFTISKLKNNYKRVVGLSKTFNPELAKLSNKKSAARMIADLKPFERTPVTMYTKDMLDGKFAVWYLRLREPRKSQGPFDGIVKLEKILVTDTENDYGLDSSEVDKISAWVVNERNPVSYGHETRWANHIYPVYLTESYIKSKYLSALHFVNLF
jgi:hypothetical protein